MSLVKLLIRVLLVVWGAWLLFFNWMLLFDPNSNYIPFPILTSTAFKILLAARIVWYVSAMVGLWLLLGIPIRNMVHLLWTKHVRPDPWFRLRMYVFIADMALLQVGAAVTDSFAGETGPTLVTHAVMLFSTIFVGLYVILRATYPHWVLPSVRRREANERAAETATTFT